MKAQERKINALDIASVFAFGVSVLSALAEDWRWAFYLLALAVFTSWKAEKV